MTSPSCKIKLYGEHHYNVMKGVEIIQQFCLKLIYKKRASIFFNIVQYLKVQCQALNIFKKIIRL